ncbi:MAG: AraC family transcriptional regulator [Ferruginibacter sp.]
MNQFALTQGISEEIQLFPHITEIGSLKNPSLQLDALPVTSVPGVKFFYVIEGKFQWSINNEEFTFFPGDMALILPGQHFGNANAVLEVGCFSWLQVQVQSKGADGFSLGESSSLSANEIASISKILLLNSPLIITKFNEAGKILKCIQQELFTREVGHCARVNNQVDELFILSTRQLSLQNNPGRDFSKTFLKLEESLRNDLSHQWTVEEMAAVAGMGTTLFNDKVKSYSGFSPLNYLINIRISAAIKLLKKKNIRITDIAFDTGFYSSQHFSTTFKKLTGYTPGEFRKNIPEPE